VVKLLNFLTKLHGTDICTGSRLTNALNKFLLLTYKVVNDSQLDYTYSVLSTQPDLCSVYTCRTRSSSVVILARPSVSSPLQITNRSFRYASHYLWNQPHSLLRSVNLILLTLLVHLILHASLQHIHVSHLRCHHLSLPHVGRTVFEILTHKLARKTARFQHPTLV